MLPFILNQPKTMLEVGCRDGGFTALVKSKYAIDDCWGVEPDEQCAASASKVMNRFFCGYFDGSSPLPHQYFDLIVFNDVLEHMANPWDALKLAHLALKDDGVVIASLPNIRHKSILKDLIFKDEFTYTAAGILDKTHLRFFTKKTMIQLFEGADFNIEKMSPVHPVKRRRWYKSITKAPRRLFHFVTGNVFESMQHSQYGFSLRKANR